MNILTLHVDPTLPRYGTDLIQAHRKIQTASPQRPQHNFIDKRERPLLYQHKRLTVNKSPCRTAF